MKKLMYLLLTILLATALVACGNANDVDREDDTTDKSETAVDTGDSDLEGVEISILLTKPEITQQFEETAATFTEETGVKIDVIPLGGQVVMERMTTLYSSGNAPTITLANMEIEAFKDSLLDLADEPWADTIDDQYFQLVNYDGVILGQPLTVEAFGFIYNKEVLDEATGGFDPSTIRTHDDLRAVFEQVDALDGVDALTVSPVDWSLGAHLTNPLFAAQSPEFEERQQFMQDAIDGKVTFIEDEIFNGWVDTIDLMKEFNKHKNAPLAPAYEDAPLELATGQVGFWFMGNWAYPQLQEVNPDGEFGFIPVVLSNNEEDYGNSQISIGAPSYWVIDADQSTKEEQEAAKLFLNWLVSSESGKDHYVNTLNLIPVSSNFDTAPNDPLSQDIAKYMEAGNALDFSVSYYPTDAMNVMGASLQKYLADEIDREGLANEFDAYWSSVDQ
ncbi:extracellular solute-binding protein [Globicatella sulfidifaciens]|uniref:Extracellular solute-binding protein n=1 Tax=Globicatella sulfidifaciens TaxID=136093 RepID=A0A7X8C4N9_9LACT|nr:extracellular solute-binding protein [Globicatella sulfidifaciens]NLJ18916.1 extracellular solute-binding protein [Globicatella sulfidifaciens]